MFHVCFDCGRTFPSVNVLNAHQRPRCVRCGCARSCALRADVCQIILAYVCNICARVFLVEKNAITIWPIIKNTPRRYIQEDGLRMHVLYVFNYYFIIFIYYSLGFFHISRSFLIIYMI